MFLNPIPTAKSSPLGPPKVKKGPNRLFLGLEKDSKTVLGATHVVEQLSFSMFPLILTFDFDLIRDRLIHLELLITDFENLALPMPKQIL